MVTENQADRDRRTDLNGSPQRLLWILTLIPLFLFVCCTVAYLMMRSELPTTIAIHVGPDGFGFGSMQTTALIQLGLGLVMLSFGTRYVLNRLKIGYWYMAEKTVGASFISIGYSSLVALLVLIMGGLGTGRSGGSGRGFHPLDPGVCADFDSLNGDPCVGTSSGKKL